MHISGDLKGNIM